MEKVEPMVYVSVEDSSQELVQVHELLEVQVVVVAPEVDLPQVAHEIHSW
jgi:L-arabinose isomerase